MLQQTSSTLAQPEIQHFIDASLSDPDPLQLERRVRFVEYQGKNILLLDASQLAEEEDLLTFIRYRHQFLMNLKVPEKSLLIVADITNIKQTPKVIEALKKSNATTKKYYKQVCAVGVVGFKKSLLHILNKVNKGSIVPKSSRQEAMEYLVNL